MSALDNIISVFFQDRLTEPLVLCRVELYAWCCGMAENSSMKRFYPQESLHVSTGILSILTRHPNCNFPPNA